MKQPKPHFVIADLHLGHEKINKFLKSDGTSLRPYDNVNQMHEDLIEKWNSVVPEHGVTYVLGDVAITQKGLDVLHAMNGTKRLVFGNHDIYGYKKYAQYFKDMYAYKVVVDKCIMSHIPLHPDSVTHRYKVNVHGHTHANEMMKEFVEADDSNEWGGPSLPFVPKRQMLPDPRFLCVSVEQPWMNFTPLHVDAIEPIVRERFKAVGWKYPERKAVEYKEGND